MISANKVNPDRVIEINNMGGFYVVGALPLVVEFIKAPSYSGYYLRSYYTDPVTKSSALFKLDKKQNIVAPAVFKSQDMAQEVADIVNRKIK